MFVRPALQVVIQNDVDFVDVVLLYPYIEHSCKFIFLSTGQRFMNTCYESFILNKILNVIAMFYTKI
jgi:hypothetical protein